MVRLTIELIRASPQFQNPCKQRELDVRGNKIPAVENMGATDNQFEVIDLSDNELTKLQNFGRLDRLVSILANNNKISRVGELPPSVDSLILTNNRLTSLGDLAALGELPALRTLSLLKNPVARQQHYREYLVHLCPKLRFLDFQLVKEAERKQAARFFKSAAGKKLLEEVRPSTEEEVLSASQDERAAPSLAPAIAKRKKLSADIVQKIQVRFLSTSLVVNWRSLDNVGVQASANRAASLFRRRLLNSCGDRGTTHTTNPTMTVCKSSVGDRVAQSCHESLA